MWCLETLEQLNNTPAADAYEAYALAGIGEPEADDEVIILIPVSDKLAG